MDNTLITEDVHLPSHGKIYDKEVNPDTKIRSMTTNQEMQRLSHSDRPLKNLCDIIDACIVGEPIGISSYDLCLGDYQYLLHRLRIATYGSKYKLSTTCPYCYTTNEEDTDLDSLVIKEYTDEIQKYLEFDLPVCGKHIKLKPQTPRTIDNIEIRKKDFKKKNPNAESDPSLLYTISSRIDSVDGSIMDTMKLELFIRQLNMRDTNYILKCLEKINSLIGIDPHLVFTCKECGVDYDTSFRTTSEFFGPSID